MPSPPSARRWSSPPTPGLRASSLSSSTPRLALRGTAVKLLHDFPGTQDSNPQQLLTIGRTLFSLAKEPQYEWSLYKTDGTSGGTSKLLSGFCRGAQAAVEYGGYLFFLSQGEIWRSDGTPGGRTRFGRGRSLLHQQLRALAQPHQRHALLHHSGSLRGLLPSWHALLAPRPALAARALRRDFDWSGVQGSAGAGWADLLPGRAVLAAALHVVCDRRHDDDALAEQQHILLARPWPRAAGCACAAAAVFGFDRHQGRATTRMTTACTAGALARRRPATAGHARRPLPRRSALAARVRPALVNGRLVFTATTPDVGRELLRHRPFSPFGPPPPLATTSHRISAGRPSSADASTMFGLDEDELSGGVVELLLGG